MKNFSVEEIATLFEKRKPGIVEKTKCFSVLLPLVEKDREVHVLFEVRARNMKQQPGEVCFPGGMIEEGETARDCAIRETCEELGITENKIKVFCELDGSRNNAGFMIYCFLGSIEYKTLSDMKLSKAEVDTTFLVPLRFFIENDAEEFYVKTGPVSDFREAYHAHGLDQFDWGTSESRVSVYHYPKYPDFPIWGLTGRMVENFARIIRKEEKK